MKENMILQKQHFNDFCIMEDILNTIPYFTNFKILNVCRLYLGVTFLSEILNIKGSTIITGSVISNNIKIVKSNIDWSNLNKKNTST